MSPRTPLKDRPFPDYSKREEFLNSLSHAVGAVCAVVMMVILTREATVNSSPYAMPSAVIYVASIFVMFAVSSIYHGLPKGMPKQIMRVVDHCDIFFTIAGTYTPIMLVGVLSVNSTMGWIIFGLEWGFAIIGATLNAIDLKKYSKFSMICYIVMGWCVIVSLKPTIEAMTLGGFMYILAGGVAYTIGAVLYLRGRTKPYRHFVFHIFVLIAAIVQFLGIYWWVY